MGHCHGVFPAHAGMNRQCTELTVFFARVPRTRGDEPAVVRGELVNVVVFPAHAGMNRLAWLEARRVHCVPRTRGDEPSLREIARRLDLVFPAHAGMNRSRSATTASSQSCSPHTRG